MEYATEEAERYFMDASDEMIDYLGEQGVSLARNAEAAYQRTRDKGYYFLNVLLAGIGASILLLYHAGERFDSASVGLCVFAAGWIVCAAFLVFGCLRATRRFPVEASPHDLYRKGMTLGELRRLRLYDYSYLGEVGCECAEKTARRLDRIIAGAVVSAGLSLSAAVLRA
jgi:hypothetical protein